MGLENLKQMNRPGIHYAELAKNLSERLNVLVVCFSHSWGGLEQTAAGDALDLAMLGISVQVLCLEGSPLHENIVKKTKDIGAQDEGAFQKKLSILPLVYEPRNLLDFRLLKDIRRLVDENGINLIHVHQAQPLATLVPALIGRPHVALCMSRHIMNSHNKRTLFHRLIYRRVDALIVMSEMLRKNILESHPLKNEQVQLIHLGLDFCRFNPDSIDPVRQRQQWGVEDDTLVIGLVGRIDPAKGQATFIRAAAGLMKTLKADEKVKFVLVGEETLGRASSHLDDLKKMVAQFRLEDTIVFAGYQDNIPEVMRAFDIFVMPSRQEAFGLVAIEAMAMECPIIISKGGSALEIVGEQEFGLLVTPEDAFDLQRQIRYLLDHPDLRLKMGQKARTWVRENYDRQVRIHKTLNLYCELLFKRTEQRV